MHISLLHLWWCSSYNTDYKIVGYLSVSVKKWWSEKIHLLMWKTPVTELRMGNCYVHLVYGQKGFMAKFLSLLPTPLHYFYFLISVDYRVVGDTHVTTGDCNKCVNVANSSCWTFLLRSWVLEVIQSKSFLSRTFFLYEPSTYVVIKSFCFQMICIIVYVRNN